MTAALLALLGLFTACYAVVFFLGLRAARRSQSDDSGRGTPWLPSWAQTAIGFGTNFFDTLGIGNFAPTTALFRYTRMVPDERIPGTMNVGHTLPVTLEAFLFITIVEVEPATLISMIAAAVGGAWLGAGVVAGLSRRLVQLGMGVALLIAALLMLFGQFDLFPVGGDALGLEGFTLLGAAAAVGLLGALMTIGVGLYAPCMILVSLLGMDPKAAFPIMMGACAFLMPVASSRFVQRRKFSPRPALGLTLGGIPGVLLAALIVKSLPLDAIRWLVVVVVVYTALVMLRSARARPDRAD